MNLIIKDLNKLMNIIEMNTGFFDVVKISKIFTRNRIIPNLAMIGFTHTLVKIFKDDDGILKFVRNSAINILEKCKILKKIF